MTRQTPEEFGAAFESFQRSAFRLELLDWYYAENETTPLWRFRNGLPQEPAWREPWTRFVRAATRSGKQMARVHVVDEPLSDYLQFELTCAYPANVAAGEDVRILELRQYRALPLPSRDFWLFDDREAADMIYDEYGTFLGAGTTSAPAAIASYRQVRDFLMQRSIPLGDYLTSLGMKEAV